MIYFLIPVFNEAKNIPNLKEELSKFVWKDEMFYVFSDDGSSDDTVGIIKHNFSGLSFKIIGDGINRGPGFAFNTGFDWILENSKNEKDVIVTIEADCTSDLGILSDMLTINSLGYNLVLSSVYAQGGGFEETSFIRKVLSFVANLLFRSLFNLKIHTLSSFYRVYSLSLLKDIKAKYGNIIEERNFICMLEVLIKAVNCKASIVEVPMVLKSSKRIGKSKMKVAKTTINYFTFLFKFKLK